ncbi:MAG: hypothetical protein IKW43_03925 [Bacteroidaceae bacterium]|nr:hypothetical protein [Bacteroidaceae bacterium]
MARTVTNTVLPKNGHFRTITDKYGQYRTNTDIAVGGGCIFAPSIK